MDASTQSNASALGSVPAIEVKAIRASYDAYIEAIKAGHDEIVSSLRAEHTEKVSALNNQFASVKASYENSITSLQAKHLDELSALENRYAIDIAKVQAALVQEQNTAATKQLDAVAKATKKAQTECAEHIHSLRNKIAAREGEIGKLEEALKATIEKNRTDTAAADQKYASLESRQTNIEHAHKSEVRRLKNKAAVGPNSWLQVSFRSKGRTKPRLYWHRYTAKLKDAAAPVIKDVGGLAEEYNFRRGAPDAVPCNLKLTLEQLEIKDGEEIWFDRKA